MNECPSDMSTSSPSRLRTSFIDTTSLDLSSLSAALFESDEEGRPSIMSTGLHITSISSG